jgi:hypothetical protein
VLTPEARSVSGLRNRVTAVASTLCPGAMVAVPIAIAALRPGAVPLPSAALFKPSLLLLPCDCLRLRRVPPPGLYSLPGLRPCWTPLLGRASLLSPLLFRLLLSVLGLLLRRLLVSLWRSFLLRLWSRLRAMLLWLFLLCWRVLRRRLVLLGLRALLLFGWPRGMLRLTLLFFNLRFFLLVLRISRENRAEQ